MISLTKLFRNTILFLVIVSCYQFSFSQTTISLSANAGLTLLDGNYGGSITVSSGILIAEKTGLELGYNYLEIESQENSLTANRYSLLLEQYVFSSDNRFKISGKTGLSLLVFNGYESNNSVVGFDFGLESSYKIWGLFFIDFGIINTLNKTGFMVQTYVGFSYDIFKSKKIN